MPGDNSENGRVAIRRRCGGRGTFGPPAIFGHKPLGRNGLPAERAGPLARVAFELLSVLTKPGTQAGLASPHGKPNREHSPVACKTREHRQTTRIEAEPATSCTLDQPARLEKLASASRTLAATHGPTEQWAWAASCLATLDAQRLLQAVKLDQGSQCIGLAPLVMRHVRGVRRLAPVGLSDLHEPMDLLAADADSLHRLTTAIVARRQPVVIERMLADSPTVAAFEKSCRGRAIFVRRHAANCPYITLDASWNDPASHLNSGRRSDLRRPAQGRAIRPGHVRNSFARSCRRRSAAGSGDGDRSQQLER